eukprot:symbB.v1.2.005087.t1/scaffold234.1/size257806/6
MILVCIGLQPTVISEYVVAMGYGHDSGLWEQATKEPSTMLAGSGKEKRQRMEAALGAEYNVASQARPLQAATIATPSVATGPAPSATSVRVAVARLLMDPAWPDIPCPELESIVHAVAQFLAGIGSTVLPSRKWNQHQYFGHFRNKGEFKNLEELVREAVPTCLQQIQKHKRPRTEST